MNKTEIVLMKKSDRVLVENGVEKNCPFCGRTYAFENKELGQIMYRNVSMVFIDKAKSIEVINCKECKNLIEIKT